MEKKPSDSEAPREVRLTVFELPSSKLRYQVPVGKWIPDYPADHLTVHFAPGGVWVYATTQEGAEQLGGLFDASTGRRLKPIWIQSRPRSVPFADLLSRIGQDKTERGWSKLKVDGKQLVAIDDEGAAHVLADGAPLPYSVQAFEGGPASGATLVDAGDGAWMFSSSGAGLVGTLVPAGKGAVALLEGGAFDLVGDVDEASLGCLAGEDRLVPFSVCKERLLVRGAAEGARAGKITWLEDP